MKKTLLLVVASLSLSIAAAQSPKTIAPMASAPSATKASIQMDRYVGKSMKTDLGYNIVLNPASSLSREWFVVNDISSPVKIIDIDGIKVNYESSGSKYQYKMVVGVEAKEPISALELRVHVFDVFGKLIKTLSATEVGDLDGKGTYFETWRIWSENEASAVFASVAYIAQVRTASGVVYEIDNTTVADQVRKVFKRLNEADMEPKKEIDQK